MRRSYESPAAQRAPIVWQPVLTDVELPDCRSIRVETFLGQCREPGVHDCSLGAPHLTTCHSQTNLFPKRANILLIQGLVACRLCFTFKHWEPLVSQIPLPPTSNLQYSSKYPSTLPGTTLFSGARGFRPFSKALINSRSTLKLDIALYPSTISSGIFSPRPRLEWSTVFVCHLDSHHQPQLS
jgi:hypothetical protein